MTESELPAVPDPDPDGLEVRDMQDELLKSALARGMSYRAAGDFAGVSQRTVARRMAIPAFAREVAGLRLEHMNTITGLLSGFAEEAFEILRRIAREGTPSEQRQAARDLLRLALAYRQHGDLELLVAHARQEADELDPQEESDGTHRP